MPEPGTITFVPSVHFSPTHRRRVRETIRDVRPDLVAVELDERRFERLQRRADANVLDLGRELSPGTATTVGTLKAIQQTVVRLYGLDPEETDMETAIDTAAESETDVALVDDPLEETVAALADRVGMDTLPKMLLRAQSVTPGEQARQLRILTLPFRTIEHGDDVQPAIDQLRRLLPEVADVLIDRRDEAMAKRLHALRREGYDVVAVIGAGHHNGILHWLDELEGTNATADVPIRPSTRTTTRIPIE